MLLGPFIISERPGAGLKRLPKIGVWRDYRVDRERLWTVITDTAVWPLWGPSLRAVRCPSRHIHRSTQGHVQTALGIWLPFQVTSYRYLERWFWRVGGVAATGHEVTSGRNGRGRLIFWVPLWAWPYTLVCWWALVRIRRLVA